MLNNIQKIRVLFLVMLVTLGGAMISTAVPAAKPVPELQNDQEELNLVMARYNSWERHNRDCLVILTVLTLCGTLCACWARSVYKNPALWFLIGFFLNIIAFGIILSTYRHRRRGRRRYRRVVSYWYVSR